MDWLIGRADRKKELENSFHNKKYLKTNTEYRQLCLIPLKDYNKVIEKKYFFFIFKNDRWLENWIV